MVLFLLEKDTHALSHEALLTALKVLSFYNIKVLTSLVDYVPTPAISYAILNYNVDKYSGNFSDGINYDPIP